MLPPEINRAVRLPAKASGLASTAASGSGASSVLGPGVVKSAADVVSEAAGQVAGQISRQQHRLPGGITPLQDPGAGLLYTATTWFAVRPDFKLQGTRTEIVAGGAEGVDDEEAEECQLL